MAKALKFLPIAVRFAATELNVTGLTASRARIPLAFMRAWDLVNLTPTETLDLKDQFIAAYVRTHPELESQEAVAEAVQQLKAHNILTLGDQAFFSRLTGGDSLNAPVIFASQTMHYSLQKGAGVVGIGAGQVIPIPVDKYYRMDRGVLRRALYEALKMQRPVIMVIGVMGSTEEGAVDPIYDLVSLREEMAEQGLSFFLHCDGAYGGYMAACFRKPSGELRSLAEMQKEYDGWPTSEVYRGFSALGAADSITVDPHKLGYVPYPAGAVVFRDGRSKELVAQEAAYALGGRAGHPNEIRLGKFILEGSKPVLEKKLGVKGGYFVSSRELKRRRSEGRMGCDDEIMVFRTTLMNLFTLEEAWGAKDYIDSFLEEILGLLCKARAVLET